MSLTYLKNLFEIQASQVIWYWSINSFKVVKKTYDLSKYSSQMLENINTSKHLNTQISQVMCY